MSSYNIERTFQHEIGHVLGLGTYWRDNGLQLPSRDDPDADTHFNGFAAVAAFDRLGGSHYPFSKSARGERRG